MKEIEYRTYCCEKCGIFFKAKGIKKVMLCPKCDDERIRAMDIERHRRLRKQKKVTKIKKQTIEDIVRQCNEYNETHGKNLSYGKYRAMMEMKGYDARGNDKGFVDT